MTPENLQPEEEQEAFYQQSPLVVVHRTHDALQHPQAGDSRLYFESRTIPFLQFATIGLHTYFINGQDYDPEKLKYAKEHSYQPWRKKVSNVKAIIDSGGLAIRIFHKLSEKPDSKRHPVFDAPVGLMTALAKISIVANTITSLSMNMQIEKDLPQPDLGESYTRAFFATGAEIPLLSNGSNLGQKGEEQIKKILKDLDL